MIGGWMGWLGSVAANFRFVRPRSDWSAPDFSFSFLPLSLSLSFNEQPSFPFRWKILLLHIRRKGGRRGGDTRIISAYNAHVLQTRYEMNRRPTNGGACTGDAMLVYSIAGGEIGTRCRRPSQWRRWRHQFGRETGANGAEKKEPQRSSTLRLSTYPSNRFRSPIFLSSASVTRSGSCPLIALKERRGKTRKRRVKRGICWLGYLSCQDNGWSLNELWYFVGMTLELIWVKEGSWMALLARWRHGVQTPATGSLWLILSWP